MGLLHLKNGARAERNGQALEGARRYIFVKDQDILANIYRDSNLTHKQANPILSGPDGVFDLCYLTDGIYRVVTKDFQGNVLTEHDAVQIGTSSAMLLSGQWDCCQDVLEDTVLCYEERRGARVVRVGESFSVAGNTVTYRVVEAEATDHHLTTAGGVKFRVMGGERGYNVRAFGALGDGVVDDTAAIQAAIDTGSDVFFPKGTYRVSGLVMPNNDQRLVGAGSAILQKNADGPLISGSGDRVTLEGLILQGGTDAIPEYSGDNVVMSGNGFQFLRSASYWCQGRAIKATGAHVLVVDPIHTIATADTSGDGYDIEIGQAGTATLYHRISNWYAGSFNGGILLVDTGSHMLSNCLFGKLTIQAGTRPGGTNGGMTTGCRIGGDVLVEMSNAVFTGNQPSSSGCNVTFALGTSGCRWDVSNTRAKSISNLGNANNLILRETSEGGQSTLAFGDDGWDAPTSVSAQGGWSFPENIYLKNQYSLRIKDSSGTDRMAVSLSSSDDWFFGSDTGANFANFSSGSGGIYLAPGGSSVVQCYGGGLRPTADGASNLGTASQRWGNIYATNGAINTSDEREKRDIRSLNRAERRVAKKIKCMIRAFRWKDAHAQKGDEARIHFGVIAQEVRDAFVAEGLDVTEYGILCHDVWEASPGRTDGADDTVSPGVEAGERYGVRYDELLAFVIAAL
ncbi:glycosyl hydrolase family 28-related protein [Tropicibacter sp. Alg240-R139]|uniref:glycosyl hydrolase family 28-related protein n=1 Tax=Tropicibacter sp. Alg240-R139 TaxID=2305991 RepID=UPI0013E07CA3|nr:glycosyl hydrolase family 28-related protein [Tropicibacter sp. Alg240-R139]